MNAIVINAILVASTIHIFPNSKYMCLFYQRLFCASCFARAIVNLLPPFCSIPDVLSSSEYTIGKKEYTKKKEDK